MRLQSLNFNFEKLKFDNLYAMYLGMSSREQTIALGATIVGLFLLIFLPIMVARSSLNSLEQQIEESKKGLKQIVRQVDSYNAAKAKVDGLERSLSGGYDSSLATTLESLADQAGFKDRIDALKEKPTAPTDFFEQSAIDVRLKKVTLSELIQYLYEIENHPSKVLKLEMLDVKPRYDNKQEFDASFTVSTFRLREESETE